MNLIYGLYMLEEELKTREKKIERIIQTIKAHPNEKIPNTVFYLICHQCGIKAGSLTDLEMKYIQNSIKC